MIDPATIPKVGPTTIPRWLTWSCLALVTAAVLWVCLPLGSTSIAVPDIAADTTAPTSISQTAALDVEAFRAPVWVAPPPVAAAAPPPPPPPPLKLQLLAIVREGTAYRATLYDPDTDRLLVVGSGDRVSGQTVDGVAADRVSLRDDRGVRTLSLRDGGAP